MKKVFVGVGSNVDRESHIDAALTALAAHFGTLAVSPTYASSPIDGDGEAYHNLVVGFDSDRRPEEISATLKQIEDDAGRMRGTEMCALDLDLLTVGDAIVRTAQLKLPRSDIVEHAFVLKPLADIAPDLHHPELGRTYAELWAEMAPHATALVAVKPGTRFVLMP